MSKIISDAEILGFIKEKAMCDFKHKLKEKMTDVANKQVDKFVEETCDELSARIEASKDPLAYMTTISLTLNLPNWTIRHETHGSLSGTRIIKKEKLC